MIFANPFLLAGAGLVALPIVLHLLMRRKPRHFEFPAIRFVQRRHETNQRRLRLQHLLLLALRMGVIALLAFALARPSMQFAGSLGSQEAPVAAALIFDTAARMELRKDNRTRLEAAREFGVRLVGQLPRESQLAVLDAHQGPAVFQVDRGAALQRIERLEITANAQPLTQVLEDALRLIGQSKLRREIYIFTDLAQGAWPASAAGRLQDRLVDTPGVGVYLIDVGVEKPTNFSLGQLRLSSQVLSQRSPLAVETELASAGSDNVQRSVELFLLDDDRKPQRNSVEIVKLAGNASQAVSFRVGGLELGTHQGFVRIAGQDALAADDTRYFTVEVRSPWRLLVAAPPPAEGHALFLVEALAPQAFRKQGRASFDCQIIPLAQLAQHDLGPYAAVCLLDPSALAPAVWKKLGDWAADGHGLGVFLGRNARPVEAFADANALAVLPAAPVRQARQPEGTLHLAPRNYQHPVLSGFAGHTESIPWDAFPVFRYWELEKVAEGATVVMSYSDDRPALLERILGAGRVLTMTTPISDRANQDPWNLLPVGDAWPFVIVMNQMAGYLVGATGQQLNYVGGQTATLALDRQAPHSAYVVTTPQDVKLSLSPDPRNSLLTIAATDQPGNYRVQAGGEQTGVDRGFSVNLAPEQTQLDRVTQENLAQLFGPFPFRLTRTEQQLDRAINTGRVGRELFPLLILLVAVLLGAEHFVANRFYKQG